MHKHPDKTITKVYHAVTWARMGDDIRCGAASVERPDVAQRLAYRNAVRALATRRAEWE